jgi:hypothetical protein
MRRVQCGFASLVLTRETRLVLGDERHASIRTAHRQDCAFD